MSSVMDQIGELLDQFYLAKSRTKNRFTDRERKNLLSKLEPLIIEATSAAEMEEEEQEPQWIAVDKAREMEIQGDTRDSVVSAWAESLELEKDKIISTQVGNAYFYAYPSTDEQTDLWVARIEHREEIAA